MPEEKEKVKPLPKRPPLINVTRQIRELDVVWYHHGWWACVRLNDCSAKMIEIGPNWAEATNIRTDGNGVRVASSVVIGAEDGPDGHWGKSASTMWLVGRLKSEQVFREAATTPVTRGRTILEVVEVPMPGSAPSAKKKRQAAMVETVVEDEPTPTPLGPLLGALQSAAEQFGEVLESVLGPADESSAATASAGGS